MLSSIFLCCCLLYEGDATLSYGPQQRQALRDRLVQKWTNDGYEILLDGKVVVATTSSSPSTTLEVTEQTALAPRVRKQSRTFEVRCDGKRSFETFRTQTEWKLTHGWILNQCDKGLIAKSERDDQRIQNLLAKIAQLDKDNVWLANRLDATTGALFSEKDKRRRFQEKCESLEKKGKQVIDILRDVQLPADPVQLPADPVDHDAEEAELLDTVSDSPFPPSDFDYGSLLGGGTPGSSLAESESIGFTSE